MSRSARVSGVLASLPGGGIGAIADVYEVYVGLRGQLRVGLIGHMGRVYHYDADELRLHTATRYRFEQMVGLR
jgi:hypothetical protein